MTPGIIIAVLGGGIWPSWVRPENGTPEVLATAGGLTLGTATQGLATSRRRLGLQADAAGAQALAIDASQILCGSYQV
jgi:hypothetical protein